MSTRPPPMPQHQPVVLAVTDVCYMVMSDGVDDGDE